MAWDAFTADLRERLIQEGVGLPTALVENDIAAKQFDLIVLSGQLALLRNDSAIRNCREKIMTLAARLETPGNVPMVAVEMALILEVQTAESWQNIDAQTLEHMWRRLRSLIKLIEGEERQIIYTDFEDEIGEALTIVLPDVSVGIDKARFQTKVRHFLKTHADHITIQKLRRNEQLTTQDVSELERIMVEETSASDDNLLTAQGEGGLRLIVRSLVGLERDAAKGAFAEFIEFINLIIDHLTERGFMDPRRLYESPFTHLDDQGVGGVFPQLDVQRIVGVLNNVDNGPPLSCCGPIAFASASIVRFRSREQGSTHYADVANAAAPNRPSFRYRSSIKNLPSHTSLGNNREVPAFDVPAQPKTDPAPMSECWKLEGRKGAGNGGLWVIAPGDGTASVFLDGAGRVVAGSKLLLDSRPGRVAGD